MRSMVSLRLAAEETTNYLSTSQSHANFARPPSQCYVRPKTDLVIFLRFKGLTEITGLLSPDY